MQASMTGTAAKVNEPTVNISMSPTAPTQSLGPNQSILLKYPIKFVEMNHIPGDLILSYTKNTHGSITYEIEKDPCACFSCREFENDYTFVFNNWRKPEKLSKHESSEKHVTSMTKWALYIANPSKRSSSVLDQINSAHKQQVISTWQYLQVIIASCFLLSRYCLERTHVNTQNI